MKIRLSILFIFATISIFFSFKWFSNNTIFAAAEEGLFFYSLKDELAHSLFVWHDVGSGFVNPTNLSKVPLLVVLTVVNSLISSSYTQHILFITVIFTALFGMYLLTFFFTKKGSISFYSSLFYLLNLYTLSQVLGRYLTVNIIFWSYMPLFLYLWLRFITNSKGLLTLLISTIVFSYVFSSPANLITFWGSTGFITFIYLIQNKNKSRKIIIRSIFGFALWVLTNIYWLYPYLTVSVSAFSEYSSVDANLTSLKEVSKYFPLQDVLQLRQRFYFNTNYNSNLPWGYWYGSLLSYILSSTTFIVMLLGMFSSKALFKEKTYYLILSTFFLFLFLVNGTNNLLGHVFFEWLFKTFSFSAVYRNPYEKFGILYLIFYSIYFSIGLNSIKKFSYKATLMISVLGILVWPMWSGAVFSTSVKVSVPQYYSDLDKYLNEDESDGRILILPLLSFHSTKYKWGYSGDEPSRFIFHKQSISKNAKVKYYWDKYNSLFINFQNGTPFDKSLHDFNVKYLIIDNSLDYPAIGSDSPEKVKASLLSNSDIKFINTFGELSLYENKLYQENSLFEIVGQGQVSYEKINPQKYIVRLSNVTSNDKLVFKNTYSDFWRAERENFISRLNHFVALDYANGWELEDNGDYNLIIKFVVWPWE